MKKEKYFIDLSKCSESEQKRISSLLPEHENEEEDELYEISDEHYILTYHYFKDWEWIVGVESFKVGKTELTYPEFIKLFEGGEGEAQVSFSIDEMIAFGKKCFYKGFDKCDTDDANCYTAWREEARLLIEQIKH